MQLTIINGHKYLKSGMLRIILLFIISLFSTTVLSTTIQGSDPD